MINSYQEFENTIQNGKPPEQWPIALQSLWYDAKGDWHTAHDMVDQLNDSKAKAIHAYLHRKEGDEWNAGYWYRQAGKPFCKLSLDEEFQTLVSEFIH